MKNKCAIYVRYSGNDDEDYKGSKSLFNQVEFVTKYANENNFQIYKVYEDYFKTGTNFNRPGIQELFEDMKKGCFNIIIVKDLSRFSRNYREAGDFFENDLQKYNIRFISILDKYDSLIDDEMLPIKNYFNTLYSKDLKKKIRKQIEIVSQTKPIYKIPKYGYIKNKDGSLSIDETSSAVVKEIFNLANNGYNPNQIAKLFNEKKIYSPQFYKKFILGIEVNADIKKLQDNPFNWNPTLIRNILRDIEYCGHAVNLTTKNIVTKDNNIMFENAHPQIISEELFNKTPKFYTTTKTIRTNEYLNQMIICKKCNRSYGYNAGKYSCPVCHSKIEAKVIETVLYEDSTKLLKEIILDKEAVLNRFIKLLETLDIRRLNTEKDKFLDSMFELNLNRNKIDSKSIKKQQNQIYKKLNDIDSKIKDAQSCSITKSELIYKFNKFINNLQDVIPNKLDVIKSVISKAIIAINNNDVELHIKYIFNN